MLGQKSLYWIDQRTKQLTGRLKEPFGGLSVILCGDFGQLPPVKDRAMFKTSKALFKSQIHIAGEGLYKLFNKVIILTEQKRVNGGSREDQQFRDALLRLHDGASSHQDFTLLKTRFDCELSKEELSTFDDALHLFYKKQDSANHNAKKLFQLGQATALFKAEHSGTGASSAPTHETNNLAPRLLCAINARVMLHSNLWTDIGLINGAYGTIVDIIYPKGLQPPSLPLAVIVQFDDTYTGPSFRSEFGDRLVPITPSQIQFTWQNVPCTRRQIPLTLAFASTIHKAQGSTILRAVIDIGDKDPPTSPGLGFVAISRIKTLRDAVFAAFTFDRLTKIKKSPSFRERLKAHEALVELALSTNTTF
jgi:ATP-dependent exoDNAse (exonuclease V) alpha subunit